jgi:hypothetical protein
MHLHGGPGHVQFANRQRGSGLDLSQAVHCCADSCLED